MSWSKCSKWSSPLKHSYVYHRLNEVLKVVLNYSLEINGIKRFRLSSAAVWIIRTLCQPVAAVWIIYVPFGSNTLAVDLLHNNTASQNQLRICTAQSRLEVLHTSNCVWFWTNQFCGFLYMILWYIDFTGQKSQGFVVEMFLIPLQYHVMFLLTEHIVISVASSSAGNLFKICSSVKILLLERNWNSMKPTCDFSTTFL